MIDWDRVSELREEIGAEDYEEVAELFLMEVEDTLAQLDGAILTLPGNGFAYLEHQGDLSLSA